MGGWALEVRRTEEADGRQRWRPTGDRWGGGGGGRGGGGFFFFFSFPWGGGGGEGGEAGVLGGGGWGVGGGGTGRGGGGRGGGGAGGRGGGGGVGRCGEAFFFLLAFSLVRAEDERDEAGILEVGPGMRGEERGGGQGIKKECESAI